MNIGSKKLALSNQRWISVSGVLIIKDSVIECLFKKSF